MGKASKEKTPRFSEERTLIEIGGTLLVSIPHAEVKRRHLRAHEKVTVIYGGEDLVIRFHREANR